MIILNDKHHKFISNSLEEYKFTVRTPDDGNTVFISIQDQNFVKLTKEDFEQFSEEFIQETEVKEMKIYFLDGEPKEGDFIIKVEDTKKMWIDDINNWLD